MLTPQEEYLLRKRRRRRANQFARQANLERARASRERERAAKLTTQTVSGWYEDEHGNQSRIITSE